MFEIAMTEEKIISELTQKVCYLKQAHKSMPTILWSTH